MKSRHCLAALLAVAVCLAPSAAREKPAEPKTNVKVYLSAEHAPEGLKAGSRANLVMVTGSAKTKGGKAIYMTKPVADGVEIVSFKREKKPESPDKAVLVELKATKDQAAKIEKMKTTIVTIAESGGTVRKAPIPLRLEVVKPEK
jgi:hypothetical protein